MTALEIVVSLSSLGLIGGLGWFFFGPKSAQRAELAGGRQQVEVTVKGGYSPSLIRVRQGVPLRLVFDRQENSDCTARVVFPDFHLSRSLPAFKKTAVELVPAEAGEFGFACGMNMVHGTLIVEPAAGAGEQPAHADGESGPEPDAPAVAQAVGVGPRRTVEQTAVAEFALFDQGVSCPTCVAGIEAALKDLPGVDRADVNYGAGRVTVGYDAEQISPAAHTRSGRAWASAPSTASETR